MEINFFNTLALTPKLNESQIQFLSLLRMNELELQSYIEETMLENPMLDVTSSQRSQNVDFHDWYQEQHHLSKTQNSQSSFDTEAYLNLIKSDSSPPFIKMIWEQLDLTHCSSADAVTISYLIESLDEKGFLPYTAKELSSMSGIDLDYIESWILSLKDLEPVGLFSYDVADCLKAQLSRQGCIDTLAYQILDQHFDLFVKGKITQLAKIFHVTVAKIKEAYTILAQLSPYPDLESSHNEKTTYIIPDVMMQFENGKWEIRLNDSWYENFGLCDYYFQLMHTTKDPNLKEYLRKKYIQVRMITENIAKRRETLISLSQNIAQKQNDFLRHLGPLIPMTMEEMAVEMSLNKSTISRAVHGKYAQTPVGVINMKNLFTSGYSKPLDNTPSISSDYISHQIKELIASENNTSPYSDQWIADYIAEKNNIKIARRTIAKYRENLGIPSSRKRTIGI